MKAGRDKQIPPFFIINLLPKGFFRIGPVDTGEPGYLPREFPKNAQKYLQLFVIYGTN